MPRQSSPQQWRSRSSGGRRRAALCGNVLWLLVIQGAAAALAGFSASAAQAQPTTVRTPLCIVGPGMRIQRFSVELADQPDEHRRGLMFRRSMEPGHGMLFVYAQAHSIAMWMKNTFISLDMLFIRDARVISIASRTPPRSEGIIRSDGPAEAVLEIVGGEAQRRGLRVGDRVRHAALGTACP